MSSRKRSRDSSEQSTLMGSHKMKRVVSSVERSRDKRLFRCSEHAGDALTYVRRLREERELCDVKMVVGGREFFAHKVVLVSTVPYLRAMFASGKRMECVVCKVPSLHS
jgi:hypothetical protein